MQPIPLINKVHFVQSVSLYKVHTYLIGKLLLNSCAGWFVHLEPVMSQCTKILLD